MLAASLKETITIQNPTETKDTIGNVTTTWATLGTRRAKVTYGTGRKFNDTDLSEDLHSSDVEFEFRHIEDMTHKSRIVFDSDNFGITSIEKLRRREGFKVKTNRRENG